jgi:archaemetzincin
MRDAEGKNPTNEETEFCKRCKKKLINKGWLLK